MSWGKVSGALLVLGFIALLAFGLGRDPNDIPSPLVDQPAPDFHLETLAGGDSVGFDELRGVPMMVNFWASWCVPCIQEHRSLMRAWRQWGESGEAAIVGILYQDSPDGGRRFLQRYGGGWTQLRDPRSRAAIDFGVYGVPETFFVDAEGRVTHKQVGPVSDSILARHLAPLVEAASASSEPEEPDDRAGGGES